MGIEFILLAGILVFFNLPKKAELVQKKEVEVNLGKDIMGITPEMVSNTQYEENKDRVSQNTIMNTQAIQEPPVEQAQSTGEKYTDIQTAMATTIEGTNSMQSGVTIEVDSRQTPTGKINVNMFIWLSDIDAFNRWLSATYSSATQTGRRTDEKDNWLGNTYSVVTTQESLDDFDKYYLPTMEKTKLYGGYV